MYERRCKYVSVAEKKYWKHITYEYMTDESDDDENEGVIILHKHKWRSQCKLYTCVQIMFNVGIFLAE